MTLTSSQFAYTTLLTRPSYLPGVLILAQSLHQYSTYPLIVLNTSNDRKLNDVLSHESGLDLLLHVIQIEPLLPRTSASSTSKVAAARFADTWTKLRVFELTGFDRVVFLDADVLVRHNVDELFTIPLPGNDWLAAMPSCVCNLDGNSWAPKDWNPGNCAHTLSEGSFVSKGKLEPPPLNSGVFVFQPSKALQDLVMTQFAASDRLDSYACPDQDFMAYEVFKEKWAPLSWTFNGLKTMRYWHVNLWDSNQAKEGGLGDKKVKIVHYIVDKPWEQRIASDGVAGHLGRDGVTHKWWWTAWEGWKKKRMTTTTGKDIVNMVEEMGLIAKKLNETTDREQVSETRQKGLPKEIPTREGMKERARIGVKEANRRLGC